uniref:Uncharacterized protein n=1 Tax=Alexandrium catenella TaxID=2925 RepID=A0A7S1RU84_ALECA
MARGNLSRAPTTSSLLAGGQEGFSYTPMPGVAAPRGVDLNLDGFDLSEARKDQQAAPAFATGSAFFRSLDGDGKAFNKEDACLLKNLFNPVLSDRRTDGDLFMPPDASPEYLEKLRTLIKEEREAFEKRKEQFLSPSFQKGAPGPLFPSDWVPAHELTNGQPAGARELHAREDYGTRMERMLKTATPVFDKAAEDGTKFRIYEVGSLEVRTIQEHDGDEQIGVVFSTRAPRSQRLANGDSEKQDAVIVRATQFVEGTLLQAKDAKRPPADVRFYVVLETSEDDCYLTEKIGDHATWVRNPHDLEARNSYAKATRSVDCANLGISLLDVKKLREEELGRPGRSSAERARYAEDVYSIVLPAWQRSWSMLLEKETLAVEQLGLEALWAQERGSGEAVDLSWGDLDEAQHELARSLGFDEASWGQKVCWVRREKRWGQLTTAEQQAARELGVSSAAAWDGASRQQLQEVGSAWRKSWSQLTEAERAAAKVLGVAGAGAWDTARWSLGGAWQRHWAELTDAERKAAEELGVPDADAWDRRSARVWRQGWQDLPAEERAAASRIGFDRDCWARFA